jgi:aspartyl-tRNA(Asn)/glutamyl-tRNA(Gln) amidotransferase subunit A
VDEIPWMGVVELASAIAARCVSPVEAVRNLLDRIERLDGRLRCYLAVFADSALDEARKAEKAVISREQIGPLHGVPIPVKDLLAVRGTPTTAGSRIFREPEGADSTVVARLRGAGAIILGKLNLHEFAYGPEGINLHYGTPWNPWDPETHRLPGGSSSGAGAAVAAGLAAAAIGSDTGGSIRIPAACCGTVGLKPTYGRVSRTGGVPLSWSLDHFGPLARSAVDAATVLAAIAGTDPSDATTAGQPPVDLPGKVEESISGLQLGLLHEYVEQCDPAVQTALQQAVRDLAGLGCFIESAGLRIARFAEAASVAIATSEALAFHEGLLRGHAAEYAPDVRRRILVGRFLSATHYLKGQQARALIRAEMNDLFQRFDALLAPTLPIAAPPVEADVVAIQAERVPTRRALLMFTRLCNLSGHPSIAVPCGFDALGLPLSMQIIGRPFDEATIVRIAHHYESATPWLGRKPPAV